jgi:hypothetical protein
MEERKTFVTPVTLSFRNKQLLRNASKEIGISQSAVVNSLIAKLENRYERTDKNN